jgi:hypothetical protein
MFSFPGILKHYVEFDTRTIITLDKLFGVGSFNGSINDLVCHQAIFLASSNGVGLFSIVWTVISHFWDVGH